MWAPESQARARLLGALVLVGVFAAGAVFGAGLTRWTDRGDSPGPPPPWRPPPGGPIQAMIHELRLDPGQVAALEQLHLAHRPELDAIARETMPRVRAVLDAIERELSPRLRPDQIERLEAWRKRRPPPRVPGMGPGGPGGPPPRMPGMGPGAPGGPPPFPPPPPD